MTDQNDSEEENGYVSIGVTKEKKKRFIEKKPDKYTQDDFLDELLDNWESPREKVTIESQHSLDDLVEALEKYSNLG